MSSVRIYPAATRMLKSHFRIQSKDDLEEEWVEEHAPVHVEEEEETPTVERKLDKHEISVRLSWLGKTAEGDGYTYLKAACTGLSLTNVNSLTLFKHLLFVDLSNNSLTIEALQVVTKLPYLVLIQADKNLLTSARLRRCKYLQVIIMNNNTITSVEDVYQPELSTLELGFNEIKAITFKNRMPNLRVLDLRNNVITDPLNLDFPNLDSLYLAGNKIKSLVGIDKLQNLRILHVRNNPIRLLDGFETGLPKLEYINLRNCKVSTLKQVKKLKDQTGLRSLILKGTPFFGGPGKEDPEVADEEEDPELRVEVLATLPRLTRLNKAVVTDEERTEAKDLMMQWLEEGKEDEEEEVVAEGALEEQQQEDLEN